MESVGKFIDNKFDMLFMDESESDLVNLTGPNLCGVINSKARMQECAASIERCVQRATDEENPRAGGVYCLDADASAKTLTFLVNRVEHKYIWVIQNTRPHAPLQHTFQLYFPSVNMTMEPLEARKDGETFQTCKMAWFERLRESVDDVKFLRRIFLVCTSKSMGHVLLKLIKQWQPTRKVRYLNADIDDNNKLALVDLDKEFRDFDTVIMTSVITVGTDFQREHFDELFCYACASSCDFETIYQMIGRIRKLQCKRVYMYLDRKSTADAPTKLKDVKEQHGVKLSVLQWLETKRMKQTNGKSSECAPDWLRNVHHYNKLQENLSKKDYNLSVLKHLIRKSCPWEFPLMKKTTKKKLKIFRLTLKGLKVCETEADVYDDDVKFPVNLKLLEKERKGDLLTEMDKHHMRKIKFLRDYDKKPSFEDFQKYKNDHEVKRIIDTEAVIAAGIGSKQMFEQNEGHVFLPSQELQPTPPSVRHAAIERLLAVFNMKTKDMLNIGEALHRGHIILSAGEFKNACTQAANTFNVKMPALSDAADTAVDWHSAKAFLDDVFHKFDNLQLQPFGPKIKFTINKDRPRLDVQYYRLVRSIKTSTKTSKTIRALQKKRKKTSENDLCSIKVKRHKD